MKEEKQKHAPTGSNTNQQVIRHIKDGLQLTAQLILASPLKLPATLVQGAKYVVLGISIFDGLFRQQNDEPLKQQEHEKDGA